MDRMQNRLFTVATTRAARRRDTGAMWPGPAVAPATEARAQHRDNGLYTTRETARLLRALALLCAVCISVTAWGATPAKPRAPFLRSATALVVDQGTGAALLVKNSDNVAPIASITKLMMAMVVLDADLPLDVPITIARADVDRYKVSHSRLPIGTVLTREQLLRLAMLASENRAAAALARTYPGGTPAVVAAMNRKAATLGMHHSRFVDPTGLRPDNTSTADDLARMVAAASGYPLIRTATTMKSIQVEVGTGRHRHAITYTNTDRLVHNSHWHIVLSKTGYISEAGRCLVVHAKIAEHDAIIVLLDSWGRLSPVGDANRIRRWLEREARSRTAGREVTAGSRKPSTEPSAFARETPEVDAPRRTD